MREPSAVTGPILRYKKRADVRLAVQRWGSGPADLLYIHGLQSHGGWLAETGPALAGRGIRVSVPDRRGSGRSSGPRGHLADAATVLEDYAAHLADTVAAGRAPITVVGQSFGGSILAALVATGRVPVGVRIVFCAPALGQQRARLDEAARERARHRTGTAYSVVGLDDRQYTNLPRYLRAMANDGLMVRMVTDSFRAVMIEIEDLYLRAGAEPWAGRPVHVVLPEQDPIIDLAASTQVLQELAPQARIHRLKTVYHYVEFTDVRQAYWDWLAGVTHAGV
ncbi:alpha/beta hydrolase [Micromonospora sp. KLBMP9576]|uniref:alpha/beta hydrolase n=1 Tax=Micromonospora sp. KLBMP9576 TaxID=3424769 RepID=UPI003D8B5D5A